MFLHDFSLQLLSFFVAIIARKCDESGVGGTSEEIAIILSVLDDAGPCCQCYVCMRIFPTHLVVFCIADNKWPHETITKQDIARMLIACDVLKMRGKELIFDHIWHVAINKFGKALSSKDDK